MPDRTFIDTNVLVYAYDTRDPEKQSRAQARVTAGIEDESAVISVQVLSEFFTVVTRRIPSPLSIDEAEQVMDLLCILPVVELDIRVIRRAIGIHRQYGISYWDSLIVAAAQKAECAQILTQDLNAGQPYEGILVVNPF